MGLTKGKTFVRKSGGRLYKWSPLPTDKKNSKIGGVRKYFCSATPNSQGEDWVTTYVYEVVIINGIKEKHAYVVCDYVV